MLNHFGITNRLTVISVLLIVVASVFALVTSASAERDVLSDVDCVVEPSELAELGSAVPGLLEAVYYDRADYVVKGAILAELESSVELASLSLAERVATLSTAVELRQLTAGFGVRTRERNQALFQQSSISSQSMDQVHTESRVASLQVRQEQENLELAQLEAVRARAALERRVVRSPFDGAIVQRFKSVGEYVEGEPVYQIAQLDPLHIEVILPLEQLGVVGSGMRGLVTLTAPGFADRRFEAIVRRIDPVADAASGTYGVRLELPNPDLTIPAGVRCQIDFVADNGI